ncbi:MAG: D-alanine--D-alanine ligase [Gammaproteobacteria bacterium]
MSIDINNPKTFGKVAVLYGGWSAERDVSLTSGATVLAALKRCGVDAHGIDAGRDVLEQLVQGRFQRAFNVLHGRGGEDGVIQGALEVLGLPYTGSGVLGSALTMDKLRTKMIWRQSNFPTPPWAVVKAGADPDAADLKSIIQTVGLPLAIKPIHEGSSIGITKVTRAEDMQGACALGFKHDHTLIAERWIAGGEFTAGVLGAESLPLIRMETPRGFYDFQAKYLTDTTHYHCPCGLPSDEERTIAELCRNAFVAVGASGWGRVDLMLDRDHQPWLLEVNTVPGMTDHSLVPKAAAVAGIKLETLVLRILATSMVARAEA